MGSLARSLLGLVVATAALTLPTPGGSAAAAPAPRPACHGRAATIVGTEHADVIRGTPGPDVIVALGGDDSVTGLGGDDRICGGNGADLLTGGPGDDRLHGGRDSWSLTEYGPDVDGDVLLPGPGDDHVDGGYDPRQARFGRLPDQVQFPGADGVRVRLAGPGRTGVARGEGRDRIVGQPVASVMGSPGDDVLVGGPGDDTSFSGAGSDTVHGRGGDDELSDGGRDRPGSPDLLAGGPGADELSSFTGGDRLLGGGGDDAISSRPAGCPVVDAGPGQDAYDILGGHGLLSYDAATGAVSNRASLPVCGSAVGFEDLSIDNLSGSMLYQGTEGPDRAELLDQRVTAHLLGGDDRLTTGPGDDAVFAGPGHDVVDAGLGVDACLDTEEATDCESTVFPAVPTCDGRAATILAPPAGGVVLGTPGDDVIFGSDGDDRIDAGPGDDVLCGRTGSDTLIGGEGDDRLLGGTSSAASLDVGSLQVAGDTIVPGPGDDVVDLGWDPLEEQATHLVPDRLDYSGSAQPLVVDLGAGTVTGPGSDTVVGAGPFELRASPFGDTITGSPGDDTIAALAGDDVVDGGAGDDTISAGPGAGVPDTDRVAGGPGADTLVSEDGSDTLLGGDGDDLLRLAHGAGTGDGGGGDDRVAVDLGGDAARVTGGEGSDELSALLWTPARLGTVTADARLGVVTAAGATLMHFAGFEDYLLRSRYSPWVFEGGPQGERVAAESGAPLTVRARGGDDVLSGTLQDDLLHAGAGHDRVRGRGGRDVCVAAELARGCERLR